MPKNVLAYKGYVAKVQYDAKARLLRGKIDGIVDSVDFECSDAAEVEEAFHQAVDGYLAFCESVGRRPAKPYKGQFNVRIDARLHRALSLMAAEQEESLNALVEKSIAEYVAAHGGHDA